MKRWWYAAATAVGMASAGCQDPPEIVPVMPPGVELKRMPEIPEGEGAQALGEQAVQASATESPLQELSTAVSPPTPIGKPATTKTGLIYETVKEGTGAEAKPGQTITVHYTGTLTDGRKFDSSRDKGDPITFQLGTHQVIQGWDEGLSGMRVGERRKLTIPPEMAYGPTGRPPVIPPNATLLFDVELLAVK